MHQFHLTDFVPLFMLCSRRSTDVNGDAASSDSDEQPLFLARDAQVDARVAHADRGSARIVPPDDPPPHYFGHRERLRARFCDAGADAIADYELLELVLFRAIPRRDVKPLAKELIRIFGSFAEVISAPRKRLHEEGELSEAVITELKIVQAAAGRITRGEARKRPVLSSWSAVIEHCRTTMAFESKEQFKIIFLDKRNQIIADEVQQTGTVDHTPVYPREVVEARAGVVGDRDHPGAQSSYSTLSVTLDHAKSRRNMTVLLIPIGGGLNSLGAVSSAYRPQSASPIGVRHAKAHRGRNSQSASDRRAFRKADNVVGR